MNEAIAMRAAEARDMDEIRQMLERNGLPTADLDSSRPFFLVARQGATLLGAAGLEAYGTTGLLRSIVIADGQRGTGVGRGLVESIETAARQRGLRELVLLTETARDFFAKLGYADIARERAPAAVRESAEFRSLCPQSASCMAKRLDAG